VQKRQLIKKKFKWYSISEFKIALSKTVMKKGDRMMEEKYILISYLVQS
jgi:hypothetical protein